MKDLNNSQKDNLTLFELVDNFIEKQKYLLVLFISSILIASMVLTSAEDAICKEIDMENTKTLISSWGQIAP